LFVVEQDLELDAVYATNGVFFARLN
jgi:hypothetical protein